MPLTSHLPRSSESPSSDPASPGHLLPRRGRRIRAVATFAIIALASPARAADDIEEGRSLFNETCATCHGRDMTNPGLAFDLRKFPKEDPARFKNSVLNGKGQGMPPWKDKLSDEDVQILWAFVVSGG